MQLQYEQDKDHNKMMRSYGLKMWDRDDNFTLSKRIAVYDSLKALKDTNAFNEEIAKLKNDRFTSQRLFVGKNTKGEVGLFLNDSNGKPRLNIYINKQNQPVIETLNDKGEVVSSK